MKRLTTGILALSVAGTATAALAADYAIFAPTYVSASPEGQRWAVERLDYKNKRLYRCDAFFDTATKKLTGQCNERPGFPQSRSAEGPNLQSAMSEYFGGLPVGYWQIDRTTGKTEFCTLAPAQCLEIAPK
jgi:hypothetical protein